MDFFDRVIVLNLLSRPDRHAEMCQELARLDLPASRVIWYPAIDPQTAAGFINAGYRGCFLTHLAILNMVRNAGHKTVLIVEDDCDFGPNLNRVAADALADPNWGICYLGHVEAVQAGAGSLVEWPPESGVKLTHCYAIRDFVLPSLCPYFEATILRPKGSPEGGPMSPDGAFNWFRRSHPEIRTLLASPSAADQRSSRSSLRPRPWDRVAVVRQAAAAYRAWRRRKRLVHS